LPTPKDRFYQACSLTSMPVFACFLSQKFPGQTPQHFFAFESAFAKASVSVPHGFIKGLRRTRWRTRLGLIGFVFPASAKTFIFIILCYNRAYAHLSILEIGFVLHKSSYLVFRISYLVTRIAYLVFRISRNRNLGRRDLRPCPTGRVSVCLLAPKGQAKHTGILTHFQTKVKKKRCSILDTRCPMLDSAFGGFTSVE